MTIYRYTNTDIPNWYIATGKVRGKRKFGAGTTPFEAIKDAMR